MPRKKRSERNYRNKITELHAQVRLLGENNESLTAYRRHFLDIVDVAISCIGKNEHVSTSYIIKKSREMTK